MAIETQLSSVAYLMYNENGYSSILAFYGPYESLGAAVGDYEGTVKGNFKNGVIPPGFPIGIVENGILTAEYVFTGNPGGTTITANNFVKRLPAVPLGFIEVVEDGIYNIDKNFTAEPVGNAIVGGGSDSELATRVANLEETIGSLIKFTQSNIS